MKKSLLIVALVAAAFLPPGRRASADNLVANASAERVADSGAPEGWGLYVGAGGMKLTASAEEKRSGQRAACLELTGWYTPKGSAGAEADRSASGAILLAPNNGYRGAGALECSPGSTYVFSFWYKGSVPSASVSVTGWPSADADDTQRVHHAVAGGTMRPTAAWQRSTGSFRIQQGVRRFALMIDASGKQRDGFTLGKLYVDDAEIKAKAYPDGELRAVWCGLPKAQKREEGLREIRGNLDKLKASGFNTLLVWTSSLYLAALDRPELWLSANGSGGDNPDWYIGRDWTTWARRGYLDFYVPQLYTKSVEAFTRQGIKTKERLGECDLVTGMAVSWSGIYPERQQPKTIKAEIAAARKLGAKGFVVFHLDHFQDGHFQAVRESLPDNRPQEK